jgi:hypothetical protein
MTKRYAKRTKARITEVLVKRRTTVYSLNDIKTENTLYHYAIWWRRRESNPRPEIFHCSFYIHSLRFEFRLRKLPETGYLIGYPVCDSPISRQESETGYSTFLAP